MPGKPKIAIIGKGNVGGALHAGLRRAGYSTESVGKDPPRVSAAARDAQIVILAVPFPERRNALQELGSAVDGKVLVDVTNAVTKDGFAGDLDRSGAEELQELAPKAHVVKAFNTVFAPNMPQGRVHGEPLSLFLAGDDAEAKQRVAKLGRDLGFDVVDAGPLAHARWLETLGYLNIQLGYTQKLGTGIGWRLVHAPSAPAMPSGDAI
jgi:8-hydroxy-5-deazaflavin:NADPH oxidoreductase